MLGDIKIKVRAQQTYVLRRVASIQPPEAVYITFRGALLCRLGWQAPVQKPASAPVSGGRIRRGTQSQKLLLLRHKRQRQRGARIRPMQNPCTPVDNHGVRYMLSKTASKQPPKAALSRSSWPPMHHAHAHAFYVG